MGKIEKIKAEIQEKFGFVPPFFEPAQENPQVLEHLWQQTLSAYVGNPLSPLLKEKLFAYLSRYCAVPYCMICHSCSLHNLGMKAQEVLELLESPPPTQSNIDKHLDMLVAETSGDLTALLWSNSALEKSLFYCSIYIFLEVDDSEYIRSQMRRILGPVNYQYLVTFVAYVKSCHVWIEAHPEVSYATDQRAIDHLGGLLEEPGLAEFFHSYRQRVRRECQSRAQQLAESAQSQRNEAALWQSEEQLRLALEAARMGIWNWDILSNKMTYSINTKTNLGLAPGSKDCTYESLKSSVHPEDHELVTEAVHRAIEEGADYNIEFRVIWPDSSVHWVASFGQVYYDLMGKAVRMTGVNTDISDRIRLEAKLSATTKPAARSATSFARARHEELSDFFENASIGLHWVGADGYIKWANPAELELLGYTYEEYIGQPIAKFHADEKVINDILQRLAARETLHNYEARLLCKDGSIKYVLISSNVFWKDDQFIHTRCFTQDITERKRAQEELQRQNLRLQLFSDIALKIRQSLQLEEILQTTVQEVQKILQADRVLFFRHWPNGLGKVVTQAMVPGQLSLLGKTFSKEVFSEEYRQLYCHGRIRMISDIKNDTYIKPCLVKLMDQFGVKAKLVVPILQKQELWGLLIVHQCDRTRHWQSFEIELLQQLATQVSIALAQSQLLEEETRQRQELAAYNAELQQFAYVASHDLQEPLRKIQAFGDRLQAKFSSALTAQGRDYIERMQNAAGRMQILIEDLLTFSRVTSQAQPFVNVSLTQITQEVLSDLEVRIQETRGRIEVGDLPNIDADPIQMRQLLQNLIGNALKFHRSEEPPVISISSQLLEDTEQSTENSSANVEILHGTSSLHCQLIVHDNGIGFEMKYLDRIFNLFQRLHGRSEYEGTGMGLAICRKIAERHGGSITATSTLGQGATFIVTLPIKQNEGKKLMSAPGSLINGASCFSMQR